MTLQCPHEWEFKAKVSSGHTSTRPCRLGRSFGGAHLLNTTWNFEPTQYGTWHIQGSSSDSPNVFHSDDSSAHNVGNLHVVGFTLVFCCRQSAYNRRCIVYSSPTKSFNFYWSGEFEIDFKTVHKSKHSDDLLEREKTQAHEKTHEAGQRLAG